MSEQFKQSNFPRMIQQKNSLIIEINSKMTNESISGALTECMTPVNSHIEVNEDFFLSKLRALNGNLMPDDDESLIASNEESEFLYYPPNSPDLTYKKAKSNISHLILE